MVTPRAYSHSQARRQIWAVAAGLIYSHWSEGSELFLTYTAVQGNAGSLTHWVRPGIELESSWVLVNFLTAEPQRELHLFFFKWKLMFSIYLLIVYNEVILVISFKYTFIF